MASLPSHPVIQFEVEVDPPSFDLVDLYSISIEVDTVAPKVDVTGGQPVLMFAVIDDVAPPSIEMVDLCHVTVEVDTVIPQVAVTDSEPVVIFAVTEGQPGKDGRDAWERLTRAEFDALASPDPNTFYIIIG